ncbi:hypothetical protein TA3x_004955 [Tundrisphaera sp. TA3]|uniref:hypothetical protein n=1 Tax=Tundrisphaera sp. TA3 TaxID=3435775 RepID=UPI003EBC1804
MILTHLFVSPDAQARARYWLNHHGFEVEKRDLSREGSPRMALCVSMAEARAAKTLIDSIERADAELHPKLPEALKPAHEEAAPRDAAPATTPIHWEPIEKAPCDDPRVEAVRQLVDHYHE